MAERDFAEIARLSEKYSKDPKSRIFVQLADAYRKSGMIDEALDILNKGLDYHPDYALGFLILGKCYFDQRKYEQAKDAFETTLKHDPQNIVAMRMIAQICENLKDENGQISAYKGILTLDPFDASAKEKLSRLEAMQKKEPVHTISIAQEYEKQGDFKKALEVYEHLSFTDPSDLLLKEKINTLKSKLTSDTKQVEEQKLEELKVETFFKLDDVDIAPPEIKEPSTESSDTIQASELLEPAGPEPTADDSAEVIDLQEIKDTDETPESTGANKDQSLDIMQPVEAQEMDTTSEPIDILKPTEEIVPETPIIKETEPEELIVSGDLLEPVSESEDTQTIEATEPTVDKTEAQASIEELSILEPVESEQSKQAPPVDQAPPVEKEMQAVTEPPSEIPPEQKQKEDKVEPAPEVLPEPKPAAAEPIPQPAKQTPLPQAEKPPEPPPAQPSAAAPVKEPAPEPAAEPELKPDEATEKDEAASKPKEEDFKSFQDWLSGLLK